MCKRLTMTDSNRYIVIEMLLDYLHLSKRPYVDKYNRWCNKQNFSKLLTQKEAMSCRVNNDRHEKPYMDVWSQRNIAEIVGYIVPGIDRSNIRRPWTIKNQYIHWSYYSGYSNMQDTIRAQVRPPHQCLLPNTSPLTSSILIKHSLYLRVDACGTRTNISLRNIIETTPPQCNFIATLRTVACSTEHFLLSCHFATFGEKWSTATSSTYHI